MTHALINIYEYLQYITHIYIKIALSVYTYDIVII